MPHNKNCSICKNYIDFEIPEQITDSIHDVVLFVGAGVSTENRSIFPDTFYDTICDELNIVSTKGIPFPEVMSIYCKKKGGRSSLLNKIRERFNYFESWPELYNRATLFHRELGKLPCIENIITTNWDDYFEKEAKAIPFVTSEDIVFWEQPGKRVFKIHGSINNLGSIIATDDDYKKRYQSLQKDVLGSQMKTFLAKNIIVFIGYSFNDYDFKKIYKEILKEMKSCIKQAYIVTIDKKSDAIWKKLKLIPIYTDGFYFIHKLYEFFEKKQCLLSINDLGKIFKIRKLVSQAHNRISKKYSFKTNPELIYTLSYQDGVMHAIDYLVNKIPWGYSLCRKNISDTIKFYDNLIKKYKAKWYDRAYLKGYIEGLICFLGILSDTSIPIEIIPLYYNELFEKEYFNINDFERSLRKKYNGPKRKLAEKIIERKRLTKGMILHHIPRL